MDSFIELAKEIHSRNNPKKEGICVGEVTSLTPVNIRVYYNGEALDFEELRSRFLFRTPKKGMFQDF